MELIKIIKKVVIIFIFLAILNYLFLCDNIKAEDIDVSISASTVMLLDNDTGQVLYEKNSHEKIYPASITKLMTAIIAIEQCNLNDIATVSYNAIYNIPSGYVTAGLRVGEEISIEELLNLILIPSANDAANVLAEHISGSIESFSTIMNTKAIELGCNNTNFMNPSGIHNNNHYSTAYDLYLIAKYAMQKDEIRSIVAKDNYILNKTNKSEKTSRKFKTSNYLIDKSKNKYFYEYAVGGKTGYTEEAGDCVIEFAKKDEMELVAIIIGDKYNRNNRIKFTNCKRLFEEIFNNYEKVNLVKKGEIYKEIKIKQNEIKLIYADDLNVILKKNFDSEIVKREEINLENIESLTKKDNIGYVAYNIDNDEYKVNISIENINKKESKIFKLVIAIFFIYIIFIIKQNIKKKKRR